RFERDESLTPPFPQRSSPREVNGEPEQSPRKGPIRKLLPMPLHASVEERLGRLAPDQRAAAMAPPGPVLCVAPAGSGKTTTLVARIAWLIDSGADPATICAITFNKR